MSAALAAAPALYRKMGLRIGWDLGKMELILPSRCDSEAFLKRLDGYTEGLPHIVPGFSACLGVPRHAANDPEFNACFLESLGVRHARLMDLVDSVAAEDLFVDLRLLQVCGVQRFGHIISIAPPPLVSDYARSTDDADTTTFAEIQQEPPSQDSMHSLLVGVGGTYANRAPCMRRSPTLAHSFGSRDLCTYASLPWEETLTAPWPRH